MKNITPEMKEYAKETGLLPQDMPPASHPLFENNADVRTLGDLIEARTEGSTGAIAEDGREEGASGKSAYDAIDNDNSYMTRADFEESGMLATDPDEDAGDFGDEMITGAGLNRAPDITGTVRGLAPGMGTHSPLDLGADGFQIIEPEDAGDLRADATDTTEYNRDETMKAMMKSDPFDPALADDESEADGHRITITNDGRAGSTSDTLDATRRLQ